MLWDAVCIRDPIPRRPKFPAPLWHSRHSVNTTGRLRSREFVDPCG